MNDEVLTSLQNPRVKQLVALRESRQRKRTGLTRVDGARELLRALQAGLKPETIFVVDGLRPEGDVAAALELCRKSNIDCQPVSQDVYEKIRYGDRNDQLCATLAWQPGDLSSLPPVDHAFWLVVEAIEKPGNLGALLRTAEAAGVDGVILADPACDPANPNVVRASMGTLFTQPVVRCTTSEAIDFLRGSDTEIVLTRPQATRMWHDADLGGSVAIVAGAEDTGLTAPWLDVASAELVLPMAGAADSLNLAAATAILLYEVVRQRSGSA
ncbi:RNA methyltransferase [bacterium]|nr:MAG: RNA methyltransferase [bacterium]